MHGNDTFLDGRTGYFFEINPAGLMGDGILDSWGINFQRTIRRRNEEILWRGYRRNEGLRRPVNAGRLTGPRNLSQGLGLEARPSAVASWRSVPGNTDPTTFPRDISLDVNYGVTSSLRASASINTDFAEVESDQRRVNLTRFPQRFPERRDFFLEGSGVFTFAPGAVRPPSSPGGSDSGRASRSPSSAARA